MISLRKFSTIFALATANGKAGIGVIRLSGQSSTKVLKEVLKSDINFRPRLLTNATFYHHNGDILDRGMYVIFPGPKSFTGEDVVEFHIHNSPAVISAFYECLDYHKLQLAKPGEFIQRAWGNGKLDLYQVESIADILEAETKEQRLQALSADKKIQKLRDWQNQIVNMLAGLEASIDFEEEDERLCGLSVDSLIESVKAEIFQHLASRRGEIVRSGLQVVLCGPPNVGKSSLFNCILQRKVAIVSPIPGTTRDVLTTSFDFAGHKIVLSDTAGIHEQLTDEIELEGIERAKNSIREANVIVLVSSPDISLDVPFEVDTSKVIRVINKSDLISPKYNDDSSLLYISAKTGEGIEKLLNTIQTKITPLSESSPIITNSRHRIHLQACYDNLIEAAKKSQAEFKAEHLKRSLNSIGRILGNVDSDLILDVVFSSFCIGK